jgi:TRAP-type uncharacterized transport system fused permease subunit
MRLGIAAYIVPFAFIYNTSLLAEGRFVQIAMSAVAAVLGIGMVAIGLEGYLLAHVRWVQRIVLVVGGVALLVPSTTVRLTGLGLAVCLFCWEWIRITRSRRAQAITH